MDFEASLRERFEQYALLDAGGNAVLDIAGLRQFLRHCKDFRFSKAQVLQLFSLALGEDVDKEGSGKVLHFKDFLTALHIAARARYPDDSPDVALGKIFAYHIFPELGQEEQNGKPSSPRKVRTPRRPPSAPSPRPSPTARPEPVEGLSAGVNRFLIEVGLTAYAPILRRLGVSTLADLKTLQSDELAASPMPPQHRDRLMQAVEALRQSSNGLNRPRIPGNVLPIDNPEPSPREREGGGGEEAGATYEWEEFVNDDGFVFYHHHPTGRSLWTQPPGVPVRTLAMKRDAAETGKPKTPPKPVGESAEQEAEEAEEAFYRRVRRVPSRPQMRRKWRSTWASVLGEEEKPGRPPAAADAGEAHAAQPGTGDALFSPVTTRPPPANGSAGPDAEEAPATPSPPPVEGPSATSRPGSPPMHAVAGFSGVSSVAGSVSLRSVTPPPSYFQALRRKPSHRHMYPTGEGRASSPPTRRGGGRQGRRTIDGGASTLASEPTESDVTQLWAVTEEDVQRVFEQFPTMDPATAAILARSTAVGNRRILSYSRPVPDINPFPRVPSRAGSRPGGSVEPVQVSGMTRHERDPQRPGVGDLPFAPALGSFGGMVRGDRAHQAWVSSMRPGLYAPSDEAGREKRQPASSTVPGYAYRHAAAVSRAERAGNVYDRLTDPRGYTGHHRLRFTREGYGRGMAGRDSAVDYERIRDVQLRSGVVPPLYVERPASPRRTRSPSSP